MALDTITPALGAMYRCTAKAGSSRSPRDLHTQTRLLPLLGLNLDSSLKMTWFHSAAVQFLLVRGANQNGGVEEWASWAAHVMGAAIPNVLQPGAFVWFEKTQGPLMKILPVPGWRPMKQLAVRAHFLRRGRLLNDWSVVGVLSLIFV
ncbi:e3 ubiquitin-protein ligase RNF13 [Trichonephila clavipes]|nr:e3 ubiquitin-protein ligase RNF13 [Trichonephila clavipes]